MGCIVWFTGLSSAGKTTIACRIAQLLRGRPVEILDGDELRSVVSQGLGFSREDRNDNARRAAYIARMLARNGVTVLVTLISPYESARAQARIEADLGAIPFVLVHVEAPLATLEERDVKGLYRRARAGVLDGLTGVSDPYEVPASPDVHLRTNLETSEESSKKVIEYLIATGLLPPTDYQI